VSPNSAKSNKDHHAPFFNAPPLEQLSAKRRGPRWTIAGRTRTVEEIHASKTPGPGAYSPYTPGKPKPPSFSLLTRLEEKITSFAPGPGAYTHDGLPRKQIGISLQFRNYPRSSNTTVPGPGQYAPKPCVPSSPRWSLRGRIADPNDKLNSRTPGPAQYSPEKPKSARASLLHARLQTNDKKGMIPGPGAYGNPDMNRIRARPPSFSLGGRLDRSWSGTGMSPGPGAYDARLRGGGLAYSMTPRREDVTSPKAPGPGAYTIASTVGESKATGMGIGDRFGDRDKMKSNPGPGAYFPKTDFVSDKERVPAFSMTARRSGGISARLYPGPGAYTPKMDSVKPSSPRSTLHPRINYPGGNTVTPGPDHYNAIRPITAPAITLKSRIDPKAGFVSPGAGAYDVQGKDNFTKARSPAFSLGKRIQPGSMSLTPGPGQYETAFTVTERAH